ncbi:Putative lipase essential for disintegration of autophagic bodies inside the vacuole [Trachipleistophora hominis]|uniref:triacylglycerol lipase n=1 Tax=Trachipleistophora hominis TaxID=72359 RepID=L7JVZ9_TRAHO|nr:Putative lipase essential for disintegration of autophagic bodies inside the vacuole [Trachipleistophora hominis]
MADKLCHYCILYELQFEICSYIKTKQMFYFFNKGMHTYYSMRTVTLILLTQAVWCVFVAQNEDQNGNNTPFFGINLKGLFNYFLGGLKNLARIGRIFKWDEVFYKEPQNELENFDITDKEKLLLYKLALLCQQTYNIEDYYDSSLKKNYEREVKRYKIANGISNTSNLRRKAGDFEVFYTKTEFIRNYLKGIVFTVDHTTVIAYKGTSPSLLGYGNGSTSTSDRIFDNIAFDCNLSPEKVKRLFYLQDARQVYLDVKRRFPNNKIILTGHSMGAAIASAIGYIYNEYVIAFGTPGDHQIIKRLHPREPKAPDRKKASSVIDNLFLKIGNDTVHVSDCRDVIYRGACNGRVDICKISGYDIKTKCHVGVALCFDNEGTLGLFKHTIYSVVEKLKREKLPFYKIDESGCKKTECENEMNEIFK